MRLTDKELALIDELLQTRKRAKQVRAVLFACVILCIVAFFVDLLTIDYLAYCLVAIVMVSIFATNGSSKMDEIAQLLERVKSEADGPERDELIGALSKQ